MPNIPAFPQPILDAYKTRTLAVLFGSGLSLAKDVVGSFPSWTQLPGRLLDLAEQQRHWTQDQIDGRRAHFKHYVSLNGMLRELDSIKEGLGGASGYRAALATLFRPQLAAPGDVHRALAALDVDLLMTTNYDRLFELADPNRIAYTWKNANGAAADIDAHRPVLFKIHGSAEDDTSVVMTSAEYDKAAADEPYRETMKYLLRAHPLLLVGYGINDPLDLDVVFGLNKRAFGSAGWRSSR